MKKRTHRTNKEKAKIALASLRNDRTLSEVSRQYKVHATQLGKWRSVLMNHAHELFERGRKSTAETSQQEEEIRSLYEQIGRLKIENDFLKKN